MKKIFLCGFLSFLLCACTNVSSIQNNEDIELLTLFSTKSNQANKAWVGTFQLAFNEMKDKVLKLDKIEFENEKPTDELNGLNREEFNSSMLNESSYYISSGMTSQKAKEEIKRAIKKKFNETSDILDLMDWSEGIGRYYAYAMLKKQFEFLNEFDKLDKAPFNASSELYDYFGITNDSKKELDKNLSVLFYDNENSYAVSLLTKSGDIVYLYRTDENNDFKTMFEELQNKRKHYQLTNKFTQTDTFMAPNLKINAIKKYDSLKNKKIVGTSDLYFIEAVETLKIEMDNKGAKVKSEAALMTDTVSLEPMPDKPRHFNFDKPFVMFLIDSGKTEPYLALRAENLKSVGTNN